MAISYEEALSTLQSMFGPPWTRDSLDTVLRHQKGHMENTVDMVLRHGEKDPQILIDQIEAGVDPDESTRQLDEQLARQLAQPPPSTSAPLAAPRGAPHGRGTPITLPEDFLRVPGAAPSTMDDEALARMLQDELFSEELARNPDFAHLARGQARPITNQRARSAAGMPAGPAMPNVNVMEKLSELGDTTRRRLAAWAAQFNNSRLNAAAGGGTAAASPAAATAAAERRGLLDDDMDDMELAARKDL